MRIAHLFYSIDVRLKRMKRKEFFNLLVDKCGFKERSGLNEETSLASLENWDSLALIATIATFRTVFNFSPDVTALQACRTFGDVLDLANRYYEK